MKRRGFFNGLLKAAAIVALAPQLAFRATPATFAWKASDYKGEWQWVVAWDRVKGKLKPI